MNVKKKNTQGKCKLMWRAKEIAWTFRSLATEMSERHLQNSQHWSMHSTWTQKRVSMNRV